MINVVAATVRWKVLDPLLSVLLAPVCAACSHPLDEPTRGPVCPSCWKAVKLFTPPLCDVCGDPLTSWRVIDGQFCSRCRSRDHLVSRARAIGDYEGSLRSIVHALKYGGHRTIARSLGRLMTSCADGVLTGADFLVPVPLHRSRKRARGFNQAAEIARQMSLPLLHPLKRPRATPSQTDLPAEARHANVKNAFAMRRGVSVRGLVIVLIDDVSTTGATLEACARVLLVAGAREVRALTAARVVSRPR